LKDLYHQHWPGRTQAEDLRFVLDRLDDLAASGTSVGQLLDRTRAGVAGYDLGGLAAMLLAGQLPPDGHARECHSKNKQNTKPDPPQQTTTNGLFHADGGRQKAVVLSGQSVIKTQP